MGWPHVFATQAVSISLGWLDDQFNQLSTTSTATYSVAGASLVGFLQAGTGAAARTVQSKERDIYHIKDYGAVCDGVADDTTAVNNSLVAAGSGTLIWTGTPLLTSGITISKGNHIFDGRTGINSSTRPGSYIIKDSTLNGVAVTVSGAARLYGGGVVAEEGNGNANIKIIANSARWDNGYSENAGTHGWYVDGTGSHNSNSWRLSHCRSYGNTNHGFYFTGDDANAGLADGCFAQANGGDGFFSEKTETAAAPAFNTFLNCGGETNTGYGIHLKGATDNAIVGGDFESNTTGDIYIESTETFATLGHQNRASVVTDNGYYTRRLDRYRNTRGTFHPAFRGASGTTKTATAVAISGATATITSASHGYSNGDTVFHNNFSNSNLNGAFAISNITTDTYDITFRTDSSSTVPVSASGLSVTIQMCGVYSTALGRYLIGDGYVEFWARLTASAVTNISGSLQFILPFPTENVDTNLYATCDLPFFSGITATDNVGAIVQQNGGVVASFYEDVGGTPGTPSQLAGSGLASTADLVIHGRYLIAQ